VKHGTGAFCIYLEYQDEFETSAQEILTINNFCYYGKHRYNTDYVNSVTNSTLFVLWHTTGVLKIPHTVNTDSSNGSFTIYCLNLKKQNAAQLGLYRIKRVQLNTRKLACRHITESDRLWHYILKLQSS
jgi:hypothetical protein